MKKFTFLAVVSIFSSVLLVAFYLGKSALAQSKYFMGHKGVYSVSKGSVLGDEDNSGKRSNDDDDDNKSGSSNKKSDDSKSTSSKNENQSGKGSSSSNVKKIEKDEDVEDEVENELEEEELEEAEVEVEDDEVIFNTKSGVSGKPVVRIKKESDIGRIDLKIREDGRVDLKVKAKKGSNVTDLFTDILDPTQVDQILSIIPKEATGTSKIRIRVEGDQFEIQAQASTASTKFPLSVDPATNTLVVQTPSGNVNLVILPDVAINNLLRVGKVDTVVSSELVERHGKFPTPLPTEGVESTESTEPAEVSEGGTDGLVYNVKGYKNLKFFGVIPLSAQVEATVGSDTGTVISEEKPWYLDFFGFLFTS